MRLGHGPGITESMMIRGPMNVDYKEMLDTAKKLMKSFEGAKSARITAPAGTDLVLDIEDRTFKTDVEITDDNAGNLPCGEIYCAPVEDGADGVLVVDGPIGGEGAPPSPVTLEIEAGRVTSVRCDAPQWRERITELLDTDAGARTIGELGIGLNPKARLVGIMLEDEKADRTAHIAFGSNIGMPGGVNESATHIDYLVHNPTIVATFEDGTAHTVVGDGDLKV